MGTSGWCVVYIRKGMENGVVVMCERGNGRRGLMRHDELRDMGHFVPMRREVY